MRIPSFIVMVAAVVFAASQAQAQSAKAGVAAAVRGKVERVALSTGAPVGVEVSSGDPILLGDRISTGPSAGLQIILMDETVFTIGPDSAMVIDEFVYDLKTKDGKVAARVVAGAFRFVSGRVARNNPSDMTVKLPAGVIGIRGTSVEGVVDGDNALVVLRGPGADNNAAERPGRIVVSNEAGEVLITRPGFATVMTAGAPPTEPTRLSAEQSARVSSALTATTPRSADEGASMDSGKSGSVVDQSGQARASALRPLATAAVAAQTAQTLTDASIQAAQDSEIQINRITTFAQLRTLTGNATMSASNLHLDPIKGTGGGTYNISLAFNFSARTLDVTMNGNYNLGGVPGTLTSPTLESYANKSGPAEGIINPYLSPQGFKIELALAAKNNTATGRIADVIEHTVTVSDANNANVIQTRGGKVALNRP